MKSIHTRPYTLTIEDNYILLRRGYYIPIYHVSGERRSRESIRRDIERYLALGTKYMLYFYL
jgi:5,10-methylenetetrahydrofolate reductase